MKKCRPGMLTAPILMPWRMRRFWTVHMSSTSQANEWTPGPHRARKLATGPPGAPFERIPFDRKAHPIAAELAAKPVLASRAALARTISPVTGQEAEATCRATHRAEARARRLIREAGNLAGRKTRHRALYGPGLLAVTDAITRYREGRSFTSRNAAAWLALVLKELPVRDDAWARMDPDHKEAHLLGCGPTSPASPSPATRPRPRPFLPSPPGRTATGLAQHCPRPGARRPARLLDGHAPPPGAR